MTKKKLQRFAEMETFSNVIQPKFNDVFQKDFQLKGLWSSHLFKNQNPVILELGCGKGEYTTGLARKFPENNFIGIDVKGARLWRGALTALSDNLSNALFIRTRIEFINSFFGPDEISEIWITFPDPQIEKKRKRLISPRFLNTYTKFLKNNGIIHLKTDNTVLYNYAFNLIRKNDLVIRFHTDDLYSSGFYGDVLNIRTFYEQQYLDKGKKIKYLCFELPHEKTIQEYILEE
jgi:tRNA (guanine-N7-)-methyltransferase